MFALSSSGMAKKRRSPPFGRLGDLQTFLRLEIAFPPKPVLHGLLKLVERHAAPGFEQPVCHWKRVVEDGFVGEVAHREVVNPANWTRLANPFGINALNG